MHHEFFSLHTLSGDYKCKNEEAMAAQLETTWWCCFVQLVDLTDLTDMNEPMQVLVYGIDCFTPPKTVADIWPILIEKGLVQRQSCYPPNTMREPVSVHPDVHISISGLSQTVYSFTIQSSSVLFYFQFHAYAQYIQC
jgi:hypothetical protein